MTAISELRVEITMKDVVIIVGCLLAMHFVASAQWQLLHPLPQGSQITAMHFADQSRGWFTVANGSIWGTEDGGITWSIQRAATSSRLNAIAFYNSQRGCAGGDYSTWLWTLDGGAHWLTPSVPPSYLTQGITRIEIERSGAQYIGTVEGSIYKSTFPEQGWWTMKFLWPPEWSGDYRRPPGPIAGLCAVDSSVIWALGRREINTSSRGNIIVRSTDSGNRWDSVRVDIRGKVTDMYFAPRGRGWYLGDSASIVGTDNNGTTWTEEFRGSAYSEQPLNDIHGVDSSLVCAVGKRGLVVRTLDGGRTWQAIQVGGPREGCSAPMIRAEHGSNKFHHQPTHSPILR